MQLHTIGIDLGKTLFHLVGLNQRGEVVVRKKFSRKQLLHYTANLQVDHDDRPTPQFDSGRWHTSCMAASQGARFIVPHS